MFRVDNLMGFLYLWDSVSRRGILSGIHYLDSIFQEGIFWYQRRYHQGNSFQKHTSAQQKFLVDSIFQQGKVNYYHQQGL